MKALTIQQPWASLIVAGHKRVENRTWATNYRGPLLIHAGVKLDRTAEEITRSLGLPFFNLPQGGIIGRVDLIAVTCDTGADFALPDHYHWILANPRQLPFEPCRGSLSLWEHGEPLQLSLAVSDLGR